MGGPGSGGGRGGGRSEADAGDEAGGREAGWPRPLPVLQRTLPPHLYQGNVNAPLHCYDDCVTFIISSLVIRKLGRNNFDHSQPIRIPMFKRFQIGKILLYYLRLCRIL